jgi:hypothetical protein
MQLRQDFVGAQNKPQRVGQGEGSSPHDDGDYNIARRHSCACASDGYIICFIIKGSRKLRHATLELQFGNKETSMQPRAKLCAHKYYGIIHSMIQAHVSHSKLCSRHLEISEISVTTM